ncbi:hypothetical protein L618_003700000040 [Rhodococcus rhodochrous J45]|uniref:Uncharacterized protein n=1 Tax=Rhodococcus rhodochrous J45 TaxID=935266 RepID=A0A562DZ23_RHORH|nr:hypothetical protein L618_003700000040 [Rhodococcus rhodochrous J45]
MPTWPRDSLSDDEADAAKVTSVRRTTAQRFHSEPVGQFMRFKVVNDCLFRKADRVFAYLVRGLPLQADLQR